MPRIAFSILQLTLVAGIVMTGLVTFEKLKPPAEIAPLVATASAPSTAAPPRPKRTKPFAHYQNIARRNLFRTPKEEKPAAPAIDIETLKPTRLKLKLWGTITGEDGMTRAVIEDQAKRHQDFYRAGDEVSGAKVKMILREKVILSVKGEDQILEIEKPSSTARRTPAPRVARNRAPARPAPSMAPQSAGAQAPSRQASRKRAIRVKLSRLESISENPEDWQNYATTAPYEGDDGASGLKVNRITPSSPLRRLGLRNGDVLMAVDDQPVAALDDLYRSLTELSAGDELSLKIQRRGRERKLDFQFE